MVSVSDDDDFEPRLGRQRGKGGGKRAGGYASRIVVAAGLNAARAAAGRRFDGSRIGRGSAIARLLSTRDRFANFRTRRAIVKTRLVRMRGRSSGAARAHLRYIQRDGVTREGAPGELYGAGTDRADGSAFLERCKADRHQFRFIVSAEDGDQYRDLKPFVRRLMEQVEHDLKTRLDWVAVDHFNTGHPHSHIVLRGVDERGQNLVIAPDYIRHGLRERGAELATLDLGPRTTREIEDRLRNDIDQERLTAIDRRLLGRMDAERIVEPRSMDPFFHSLEAGRLQVLKRMELAEDLPSGKWRLSDDLADTLRRMGERGDIIRLMQREMTRARVARSNSLIHRAEHGPLIGRLIARGLADEHRDRHFLLVDGTDGNAHYVDIGTAEAVEQLPENAIVRIVPTSRDVREVDRTVAAVADRNGGRYSVELHLEHDPTATRPFVEGHIRRLEALRREGVDVSRGPDDVWRLASDHLAQVERIGRERARKKPVEVELLSPVPIEKMPEYEGATWLDRELSSGAPPDARDSGFGREVRAAHDRRRQWLLQQELADDGPDGFRIKRNALIQLQRRELLRVARQLSTELGKTFEERAIGERIEGRVARRVELASGRLALIEKSREFTLVPWRPVLEKRLGQQASGILREKGISWRFGKTRDGPEIG